jgi:uncharacterized membrane protein YwaF
MNLRQFFINTSDIKAAGLDIGFRLFGIGHLLWLAGLILAAIVLSGFYKHMKAENRPRVRKFFALSLLVFELLKDLAVFCTGDFRAEYLPLHLCSLAIFALLIDAFCPRQKLSGQMIAYAFMPGTVAALLFCNWTEYPFLSFMNIQNFVYHGWIFFYFLLRYRAGEIRPRYLGIWGTTAILSLLIYPLFRFNRAFGTNFMFLNEASPGSPLVPLWNIFGTRFGHIGYILSVIVVALAVFHGLYALYRFLDKEKKVKR